MIQKMFGGGLNVGASFDTLRTKGRAATRSETMPYSGRGKPLLQKRQPLCASTNVNPAARGNACIFCPSRTSKDHYGQASALH